MGAPSPSQRVRASSAIAIIAVAVAVPPVARARLPVAPEYLLLAYAAAVAGTVIVAGRRDVALRELPWRRWFAEAARATGVALLLAALWLVRTPALMPSWPLHALTPLLVAAVVEEVVFRGVIPSVVPRRAAFLVSSLAFGTAHAASPLGHTAAGALFYVLRGRVGSLVAPILAHLAYNGAVLMAMKR